MGNSLGLMLAVAALYAAPSGAATYHVAVSGSDRTGDGTASRPFASIQHAADLAQSGDTVQVGAGTYYIPSVWDAAAQKTTAILRLARSGVTYQAEPGAASHPLVTFPTRTDYDTWVEITGSHIVWDGIDVNNGVYDLYAHGGSDLTIRNCVIQWAQYCGIDLENEQTVTISRCDIHDCSKVNSQRDGSAGTWAHAVIGWSASGVTVQDCAIHNNDGEGVGPYLGCSGWTISRNTVSDNYSVNIYLDTDVAQADMVVDHNTISYSGAVGVGDRNLPVGIAVANENADLNHPGDPSINAVIHNVRIHDNTIRDCGGGLQSFNYAGGPYRLADSTFYNNDISGTRTRSDGTPFPAVTIWGVAGNVDYAYNHVRGGDIHLDSGVNSYGNY